MPNYSFVNRDGSTSSFDIDIPVVSDYTWTPGPPPVVAPAPVPPPFFIGESFKSPTQIPSMWPAAKFGLLFFNPANGTPFSWTTVLNAIQRCPGVLWCICDKGDPTTTVPALEKGLATLTSPPDEIWLAEDQEPEGEDPATYIAKVKKASSLITSGGPVQLCGKLALYADLHKSSDPNYWRQYWAGVETRFGHDCYFRPGVGYPTTRYATPDEKFALTFAIAKEVRVPWAVTEYAGLKIGSDSAAGDQLATATMADIAAIRAAGGLGISYWAGLGGATDAAGKPIDFTPPTAVTTALTRVMQSQ